MQFCEGARAYWLEEGEDSEKYIGGEATKCHCYQQVQQEIIHKKSVHKEA